MMEKMTIIRTISLFIAWLNTFLVSKGYTPLPLIDEEGIALFVAFVISMWSWWKDNDVTKKARENKEKIKSL
jgi:SPP1 family holin